MEDSAQPPDIHKEIQTQAGKEVAAWFAIQLDLQNVIEWLEYIIKNLDPEPKDSEILRGLWLASLNNYVRCFNGGVRSTTARLNADIFKGLAGEPLEAHQWYVDMRNKLGAHSVNPYEQYKTGIMGNRAKEGIWVSNIAPQRMIFGFGTAEGCRTFLELAKHAYKYAVAREKGALKKVSTEIKKFSVADIEKLPNLGFRVPGPKDSSRKRSH